MSNVNIILVPVDFSRFDHFAVEYATGLAKQYDAKVIIAHVIESISAYYGQMYWGMTISASKDRQTRLEAIIPNESTVPHEHAMLSASSVAQTQAGDIGAEICRFAATEDVDLIVIASHGRSGISDTLVGGVTEQVMRRAACPVLVVKADPDRNGR